MGKNISLCITYVYHDYQNAPKASAYRIADLVNGEYIPVDHKHFTDERIGFNPKWLRTRPGDEGDLFVPYLREWKAIPKNDDPERMITESYQYNIGEIYEIAYNRNNLENDPIALQRKMKDGIILPEGIGNIFLLAIYEDEISITVAKCRKNMFKKINDTYVLDTDITDMIHANHYLDTYVIDKNDIFSTADFTGFYKEDRTSAEPRYFYRFDTLPEADGRFFLHELTDYIPFFVSKFLKKEGKKSEFSKNQIQKITALIEEAITSKASVDTFFDVAGFNLDDVIEKLPEHYNDIVKEILEYDEIDKVIENVLENNDETKKHFVEIVRSEWLKTADEERETIKEEINKINGSLNLLKEEYLSVWQDISKANELKQEIESKVSALEETKNSIENCVTNAVNNIDSTIAAKLVDYAFLKQMGMNTTSVIKKEDTNENANIDYVYPKYHSSENMKRINAMDKAIGVLKSNLKKAGLKSYYAEAMAAIIHETEFRVQSYVMSGLYARAISNAICNSIEGSDATRITITNANFNFSFINKIISESPVKVILVENLVDYCDETSISLLTKNYPEYIFIFSVDNEESLTVLSKNIWQYVFYLNTDIAVEKYSKDVIFTSAIVDAEFDKYIMTYGLDGYSDLNTLLKKLRLPLHVRENLTGIVRFFDEKYKHIAPVQLMDSVIAKFCVIYADAEDDDIIQEISENLSEELYELYFE